MDNYPGSMLDICCLLLTNIFFFQSYSKNFINIIFLEQNFYLTYES